MDHVIRPIVPAAMLDRNTKYHINPTGRFVIGGPMGDAGVTGRKIIVDSYGGYSRHGGGAFSRKILPRWTALHATWAVHRENIVSAGLGAQGGSATGVRHWRGRAGSVWSMRLAPRIFRKSVSLR